MTRAACVICGATEIRGMLRGSDRLYRTTSEEFRVVECFRCGMRRLDPQPDGSTLERYYPANYWFDPEDSRASRLAQRYRRLVLRDHVAFVKGAYRSAGCASPVLDVGCGGGLLPGLLRESGIDAIGMDWSPEACAIAWKRHGVPAVHGDLMRHAFRPGTFGLVTLFHVIEHLSAPRDYLETARCLLGKTGRLIVQAPNADSWQFRFLGRKWNGLDIPRHLFDFRSRDLKALLSQCGFAVARTKHFSWRDNPAGLATSLAPFLDPMARHIRGLPSSALHLGAYLALVAACVPPTLVEAAWGHGSTVMIEARKR